MVTGPNRCCVSPVILAGIRSNAREGDGSVECGGGGGGGKTEGGRERNGRSIGTEHKYAGRTSHINVVGIALYEQRTLKGLLQVVP